MTKAELLAKLSVMFDAIERARMFGSIELVFRAGQVCVIQKLETERIENGQGNPHANKLQR